MPLPKTERLRLRRILLLPAEQREGALAEWYRDEKKRLRPRLPSAIPIGCRPPRVSKKMLKLLRSFAAAEDPGALLRQLVAVQDQLASQPPPEEIPAPPTFKVFSVWCPRQEGAISVAECAKQAGATEPSGGGRGFGLRDACKTCPLRDVHHALAPNYVAPRYQRFNIARENKGRAARSRLWKTGALGRVPTADDPPSGDEEG